MSVIHFVDQGAEMAQHARLPGERTKERMLAVRLPFPSDVPKPAVTMLGLTSPAHMLAKFRWEDPATDITAPSRRKSIRGTVKQLSRVQLRCNRLANRALDVELF